MHSARSAFPYQEVGFGAFNAEPAPPSGHAHDAFELSVFEGGCVTMLYGGRAVTVEPDRLVVHWGMLPHQMVRRDPGSRVVGVHIPLTWVLQWAIPGDLVARLLELEVLIEPVRSRPCGDLPLLRDWCRLFRERGPESADIVSTEVRARLLRVGIDARHASGVPILHPEPNAFSHALRVIVQRFCEPLRLRDVAAATGVSERHLSRLFLGYTGQTVNGYITNLRLSHAQRMLMTGDAKVIDVMHESGFVCPTHFYRLFNVRTGTTPAKYRKTNL